MNVQDLGHPTPDDDVDRTDDVAALKAEAKKRRLALRAAEAERDALRGRVDASDRREVERMAADRMANPADLFLVADLESMRADDGSLDPEKATATIDSVLAEREHWRRQPEPEPEPAPRFPAVHQGARQSDQPKPPSFGDDLKRAAKGRR